MIKKINRAAAFIAALAWATAAMTAAAEATFTTATATGRTVSVSFINSDIVRVSNAAAGEADRQSGAAVLPVAERFDGATAETPSAVVYTTPTGVTVTVEKASGAVNITAGARRGVSDDGLRTERDGRRVLKLATMGGGSFYGAGERGYTFNLAGDTLVMYNKQNYGYTAGERRIGQMNITMPLFVSANGYSVLFDDFAAAEMVMGNPIEYITESATPVSYYFINGAGTLAGATERLTELTGRQPLPPLWALGYITSKYGYHDEAEARGVVDTLKQRGYPLDGIVLDLYWYGKEQDMGRLAWDPEQWPDHAKMLADLKARGVNTVIISQPYILRNGRGIDNYNMLAEQGMMLKDSAGNVLPVTIWVGEGGMFDVSNEATRRWLAGRYEELTREGVGGWWGDLGEPEVHPEGGVHTNGLPTRAYHNKYGNDWSSIIAEMYAEKFPDTRLLTMMRGGTTGLQRYSVFPWSTDVSRSWGGLAPQVVIMLNSGLSGLGYMSHDVGGFAIDESRPVDEELYVRWLQLGAFSPMLRTHAQKVTEPYHYTAVEPILKKYIAERYRWLPYNYTLAWENASAGHPMVRPLNYYTGSARHDDITDEYLWGRNVLVAPVMTEGARERRVVFPDEGRWMDMAQPWLVYNAGDTITYSAPLDVLPLFVRAGAVLPLAGGKVMQNTGDYSTGAYRLDFYAAPGADTTSQLYEDDMRGTGNVENRRYGLITFVGTQSADGSVTTLKATRAGHYDGETAVKKLDITTFNIDRKPTAVIVDGKRVKGWKYDAEKRAVTLATKWDTARALEITIR